MLIEVSKNLVGEAVGRVEGALLLTLIPGSRAAAANWTR
jgi:hypothetical protein